MKIFTKVDKYTIDKLVAENKKRTEKQIFPTGAVLVPVMFNDIMLDVNSLFGVDGAQISMKGTDQKFDFGFKLYSKNNDPEAISEMIHGFNRFIDGFRANRMEPRDNGIFTCIDKIFFDLGYVGKMVKAEGVEQDTMGNISIYSINYAENLITKEDWEYQEYIYVKDGVFSKL